MTHMTYTIFIEIPRNHIDHDITFLNTTTTSTCHLLKLTNLFMHWRIAIEVIYNWIILYYFRDLKHSAKTNVQTPLILDNFFKQIILPVMQENLKFEVSLIEKKILTVPYFTCLMYYLYYRLICCNIVITKTMFLIFWI